MKASIEAVQALNLAFASTEARLAAEIAALRASETALRRECEALERDLRAERLESQAGRATLEQERARWEDRLQQLRAPAETLGQEVRRLETALANSDAEHVEMERQLGASSRRCEELQGLLTAAEEQVSRLGRQCEADAARAQTTEQANAELGGRLDAVLAQLREQQRNAEAALAEATRSHDAIEQGFRQLEEAALRPAHVDALGRQLESVLAQLAAQQRNVEAAMTQTTGLRDAIELGFQQLEGATRRSARVDELTVALRDHDREAASLRQRADALEQQLAAATTEVRARDVRIAELATTMSAQDDVARLAVEERRAVHDEQQALVAELRQTIGQLQARLERTSTTLQGVETQRHATSQQLERERALREGLATRVREGEERIEAWRGTLAALVERMAAIAAPVDVSAHAIGTLAGPAEGPALALGYALRGIEDGWRSLQERERGLVAQVDAQREALAAAHAGHERLSASLADADQQVRAAREALAAERVSQEQRTAEADGRIADLEAALAGRQAVADRLRDEHAAAEAALREEAERTRATLTAALEQATRDERERAEAAQQALHVQVAGLRDQLASFDAMRQFALRRDAELAEIRSSRAWRWVQRWRRLRGLPADTETAAPLPRACLAAAPDIVPSDPGIHLLPSSMTTLATMPVAPMTPASTTTDSLESLLGRNDNDFIEAAYMRLLHRVPDPIGRSHYLERLRRGEHKLQLLLELSDSDESRRVAAPLPGLKPAARRLRWAQLPVVGRLVRALAGTESTSASQRRLRAIEQQVSRMQQVETLGFDRLQRALSDVAEQMAALRTSDARAARPTQRAEGRVPEPVFFTICSKNFTAYARTLHESIVAHHPNAEFYMFLCDGPDPRYDPEQLPFKVVSLSQLDIPDVEGMSQRYNITEFNTAIKPFAFSYLFRIRNAPEVVYLDPDILLTSPLVEVMQGFRDGADCILTPHILNPAERAEVSDDKMLLFGIYNLGFIALRNTPRVSEIVHWWGRRLENECVIALEKGLFVDQKWADLFPAFIPNTLVLRHAGYNVAYWNVPQRRVELRDGVWLVNTEPLRFAHFSGNKLDDPAVYSRHSWTLNTTNIGDLARLLDIYRSKVYGHGHAEYSKLPYAYNWNGVAGVNLHTPEPTQAEGVPPDAGAAEVARPVDPEPAPAPEPASEHSQVAPAPMAVSTPATERASPLPRIFVTDWSTPRPDQDAGSVTTFFLLKILVCLGYDVTFVPSDLEPLGEYTAAVRRLGVRVLDRNDVRTVQEVLAREGANFSAHILFRAPIAGLYVADIRRHAPRAKVVLETVDLHYLRDERAAQADGSPAAIEAASAAKAWELGIIQSCDVSIVLSSFEQELLERELPGSDIRTMPLLFLDMPGASGLGYADRSGILFIGGFRHLPNVDAVRWFVNDIWPLVRARLPDAVFKIIGSHPPVEVLELTQVDGVEVLGHVKDLDPLFGTARLSVAPLRYGAGIKGKVATSLGYGVPVAGTSLAFEGMELRDGRHVMIGDDPTSLADAVVKAYLDESLWNRLSTDGFERVNALYSEDAGRQRVEALMDSLCIKDGDFQFHVFRSQQQYQSHRRHATGAYASRERLELSLIDRRGASFLVPGYCAVCRCETEFQVGFMYAYQQTADGEPIPNWREHLNCLRCGHTNRVRLMIHLLERYVRPTPKQRVYITEQTTPLFGYLKSTLADVTGSEFLGDVVSLGGERNGLRNEDMTRLTFADESFDVVVSCDVLEHVTSDTAAFSEAYRCLAPGGTFIFTAPCALDKASNVVRARVDEDGQIEHLITPPEYHGNPVDPENGALCFRYFGWEVLEQLKAAGFADAYVLSAWSRTLAYLGIEQIVFVATKRSWHTARVN
jgi:SAM-dependent methyltransferase/glycosyltransferase involved in cell wall biosynthesis